MDQTEQIKLLLDAIDSALTQRKPAGSIDTPEFQSAMESYGEAVEMWADKGGQRSDVDDAYAFVVAHIDALLVAARQNALEEAAMACDAIGQDHRDQYKGRGKHAPNNPRRADPHADGCADGAWQCEEAIRIIKSKTATPQASTAQDDVEAG